MEDSAVGKTDLISRAAAIAEIDEYLHELDSCISEPDLKLDGYKNGLQVAIQELNALPAVDAVPVVRCKDCKYYAINRLTKAYEPDKRFNPSVCIIGEFARPRKPDWYCADGERRDSE